MASAHEEDELYFVLEGRVRLRVEEEHAFDKGTLMYSRHTWILRRDARRWRPIAALRLLPVGPAMPRRRALRSRPIDASRVS
jgi:hypothetical protein